MTEIPKCPTCGRRPSQGTNASIRFYGAEGCDIEEEGCPDPIHGIADQGPALLAERDELRKQLQMVESDMAEAAGELRVPMPTPGTQEAKMLSANIIMRNERGKARIERDEARKRLQDARAELFTERENTARCVATIARLAAERDEARALVMELFRRGCFGHASASLYDHMCSATYADAQAALIAWGLVKREECVRE